MGFTVMESFMDAVQVTSKVGRGTTVRLSACAPAKERAARRA